MIESEHPERVFAIGSLVHAKDNINIKLRIRRYINGIYYCKIVDDPSHRELVYFGRELASDTTHY
jgi:hypothetical protein